MSLMTRMEPLTNLYDLLHHVWEHPKTQRRVALVILYVFLIALGGIELNREGLLPPELAIMTPTNHFHAINLAFTLILGLEVMGLILTLSCSLSRSLGKQFEILALILLRDAFKVLAHLPEPVNLVGNPEPVLHIALSASTALVIFICLGFYYRLRPEHHFIREGDERMRYVMSKKLIALLLFCIFVGVGIRDGWIFITTGREMAFFETIYTVLIFADILLVLVAQRFMPSFYAVFRNSGFVITTLLMRLSLSTEPPWNALTSLFAGVYVLALTWAISRFVPERYKSGPK